MLINKQDKTTEELVTDNKRIVDAINEIYGIVVEIITMFVATVLIKLKLQARFLLRLKMVHFGFVFLEMKKII